MINSSEFSKRLEKIIKFHDETASSFAEKVGVQRSSISHILSGRNKPSLDFVMKVLDKFPDVELYWLLNGKGTFPYTGSAPTLNIASTPSPISNASPTATPEPKPAIEKTPSQLPENLGQLSSNSQKEIERIVIFFKDGSFQNFNN